MQYVTQILEESKFMYIRKSNDTSLTLHICFFLFQGTVISLRRVYNRVNTRYQQICQRQANRLHARNYIHVLLHPLSFDIPLKERLLLRPTDASGIQMKGVNYRVGKKGEISITSRIINYTCIVKNWSQKQILYFIYIS